MGSFPKQLLGYLRRVIDLRAAGCLFLPQSVFWRWVATKTAARSTPKLAYLFGQQSILCENFDSESSQGRSPAQVRRLHLKNVIDCVTGLRPQTPQWLRRNFMALFEYIFVLRATVTRRLLRLCATPPVAGGHIFAPFSSSQYLRNAKA